MQIHLHETPQTGLVHALVSHLGQLSIVTKIRAEKCSSSEARDIQITSVVRGAGVGPEWSPAPGVETRNTMDRCPCLGSSIDLIIAWMFIFCRPQHQQLASRPHTEYFKSSHWNQTLRFIFRCFYSAMILTVGREWWSRHRRITGIRLMLQFGRRPGSFITTTVIALYSLVSANISHCAMSYVIQTHCIHHRYPLSRISITRNQTLSVMRIMSLKFKSHLVNWHCVQSLGPVFSTNTLSRLFYIGGSVYRY